MMWPNNDVCQGLSEPSLGFRWALAHIIIWHCLAPAAQGLKTQYVQLSTPEWYTTPFWYTFVYLIASPNHYHFFLNKMFWLHIHTNKSSTKFQVDWTSSGSTVKCSKVGVLWTLLKTLSPPNDTPIFCKFLHNNTTESSEIWRHWSYWLIESYCVVFMRKTYSLELKIEFNDFTISLRGGWLYKQFHRAHGQTVCICFQC